jgi:hypothetical protein
MILGNETDTENCIKFCSATTWVKIFLFYTIDTRLGSFIVCNGMIYLNRIYNIIK